MTGVEQRQFHIPISVCDFDLETESRNDHNNINQGSYYTSVSRYRTLNSQPSYDELFPQMDSNLS